MNEAMEAYMNRGMERYMRMVEQQAIPRPPPPVVHHRAVIDRDHVAAHQRLYEDYFAEYPRFPANMFRRRFRMRRELFMRIVRALERQYMCFRFRHDAAGRPGHTPIQKCTAAIRQLAYGGAADMWDEYLHIGESSALKCLKEFCGGVISIYGEQYLRSPTPEDCQNLMQMHGEKHGFPGMLGSIDCMHWEWKNCPTAWKGAYTTGYKSKNPTIILEAVADYRLWIWHAYFGVAGSNNDLNVLNSSPLFNEKCQGVGPAVSFVANGNRHDMGYYLADGIYPRWPVFVKTIRQTSDEKKAYFAQRQESARKDVERAFGVLQSRWAAIKGPTRLWDVGCVSQIMYACIILHNMIVEDEGVQLTSWVSDDEAGPSHGTATPSVRRGVPLDEVGRLKEFANMRQVDAHIQLQKDIIEELWARRIARR